MTAPLDRIRARWGARSAGASGPIWAIAPMAWEARRAAGEGPAPRMSAESYTVDGGVASLELVGVVAGGGGDLWWGRMTDPAALAEAIRRADADPAVSEIRLTVDSPGGSGSAMRDAHRALRACTTPTSAYVSGQCLSAAYWIASGCDRIVAHPMAMSGCVGSIVHGCEWRSEGDIHKTIRSSQTPRKAPDLSADEWDAQWQGILDETTALFLADIGSARGWDGDVAAIAERVQHGATLPASAALAAGLIDAIADPDTPTQSGGAAAPALASARRPAAPRQETQMMTEEEIKALEEERDALAARVAELEAELAKAKADDEAEAEAASEAEVMAAEMRAMKARLEAMEAKGLDDRRDALIEAALHAGGMTPAMREAAVELWAVGLKAGGVERAEKLFATHYGAAGSRVPRPVGHGRGVDPTGGPTVAARYTATVEKVRGERQCGLDEAHRIVQSAPEHASLMAELQAARRAAH
ncbi:MAG: S49 family peptidase [bacterium]